jgi:hypothetical protein
MMDKVREFDASKYSYCVLILINVDSRFLLQNTHKLMFIQDAEFTW